MVNTTKIKKNFYYKLPITDYEAVEVYVGQRSGKQLQQDIESAKSEVLIISPYIGEKKLDELISLQKRNINVRLAFNTLEDKKESNILKKLIHQKQNINQALKEKVKKQSEFYNYIIISCLVISISSVIFSVLKFLEIKELNFYFLISIPFFYLFYDYRNKKSNIEKTPIYTYDYSEKINFKYLRSKFGQDMFVHSKIYVIDRKIAYLGSVNFTTSGFSSNFETRIRITHKDKINELVEFIHTIFEDNDNFEKHELHYLGKKVYSEAKW